MDYRNDRWSLNDENWSINVRFGMLFCLLLVGQDKERTRKNVRKMDYKT